MVSNVVSTLADHIIILDAIESKESLILMM